MKRYCGPWKQKRKDFWHLTDTDGHDIGWVCETPEMNLGPHAVYISYISDFKTVDDAKANLIERLASIGWTFIDDPRLLVMI